MMWVILHWQSVYAQIGQHQSYAQMYANYSLGDQDELKKAFQEIQGKLIVPKVSYSPSFGKHYIIDNFTTVFTVLDGSMRSDFLELDVVRVSGGKLRIDYTFDFEKKLIGSSVLGKAKGSVISDPIEYVKDIAITATE